MFKTTVKRDARIVVTEAEFRGREQSEAVGWGQVGATAATTDVGVRAAWRMTAGWEWGWAEGRQTLNLQAKTHLSPIILYFHIPKRMNIFVSGSEGDGLLSYYVWMQTFYEVYITGANKVKFWILLLKNAATLFIQELVVILVETISPPKIITGTRRSKCL